MAAAAPPAPGSLNFTAVNVWGLSQYDGLSSFFADQPALLPEWVGWVSVLGFGLVFALLAIFLVWVDVKFSGVIYNSEQFNTAGRSIGAGLLAVDLVSHWTWASILLQSVSYGQFYGITGSYWYAVNDAIIMWLFAVVALELKHRAPKAHTMLEIVEVRWGMFAHFTFFIFAVVTNLLVSLSMLQGCVSVINTLTNVNVYAISFLIPIGVVLYATIGGLKATFTTAYMHTVIIYIVCLIFAFKVYVPGDLLAGIDQIYDRLQTMALYAPVSGNQDGSYLTMWSSGGLQFEVIFFFSALSQMLVDQSYWQSAIAAKPTAAVKGYFLGAFLFLGIVFSLPATLGMASLALDLPLSTNEILQGLVMPASSYVLLGKGGAVLVIVICFMAVTSSGASEMVAVSSLFTFDIYRKYIHPKASGERLVWVSRIMVFVWAIVMGCAMSVAQVANINVNFLITIIGVIVGGAVPPLACALTWTCCTRLAAIISAVVGSACGIASWLACTQIMSGGISVDTAGLNAPLLTGSIISVGVSAILLVLISLIAPCKPFDWEELNTKITTTEDVVKRPGAEDASVNISEEDAAMIARMRKPVWLIVFVGAFIGLVVWPLLSLPANVFSLGYFRFYVVLTFIILIVASIIGIFLPIWEARGTVTKVFQWRVFKEFVDRSFRGGSRSGKGGNAYTAPEAKATMDDSAGNSAAKPVPKADPV
ncbi:hypothetical protein WJX81_004136 [Elliptochloris bilobata]|uniref:Uncharacterized protein n=1 Tax=Elliptochloris bilobata TaxID=381761 RepID=A0AAW1S544_9CHLO